MNEVYCALQAHALVGECPRWHPTEQVLYWVDIYEPSLNRLDTNTGESIIVLGEGHESNMQTKCTSYIVIGSTKDPLSRRDEWLPIYHCRGFKENLQTYWPHLKRWG